jgi:hypothetical protein
MEQGKCPLQLSEVLNIIEMHDIAAAEQMSQSLMPWMAPRVPTVFVSGPSLVLDVYCILYFPHLLGGFLHICALYMYYILWPLAPR